MTLYVVLLIMTSFSFPCSAVMPGMLSIMSGLQSARINRVA